MECKTLWEKEKMLVTKIFSLSNIVFKRVFSKGHQQLLSCGKGLEHIGTHTPIFSVSYRVL